MITGAIKGKVDAIWQKMWEGGITNPLEVISQLTYLMFMRSLDEKELETERMEQALGPMSGRGHIFPETYENAYGVAIPGTELRWSRFKDKPAQEMYRVVNEFVFPFMKDLHNGTAFSKAMEGATFGFPAGKPSLLEKAVDGIEDLLSEFDDHIGDLGDLYEYMLSKISTAGTNGQFRTPKHIRDMMGKANARRSLRKLLLKKRQSSTSLTCSTPCLMSDALLLPIAMGFPLVRQRF